MPDFVLPSGVTTPFGSNEPFRSTRDIRDESYTFARASLPAATIDGQSWKILQPGAALCRITSGPDTGKVGVYQTGATDGRADLANFVGMNKTFLPWQLDHRDVEVAAVYAGSFIRTKCLRLSAGGAYEALTAGDADAILATEAGHNLNFMD